MLRDLLLLVRAPLAAGAVSNLLVGAVLARPDAAWEGRHLLGLAIAALATTGFYWGGMALNDWFDLERDRRDAPRRPLPAGRVGPGLALALGLSLLALGLAGAGLAAAIAADDARRGLLAGAAVALAVLAYDGGLKRWRHPGALAMGACRASNALLGGAVLGQPPGGWALVYAGLLLWHVQALTLVSTWEDEVAPPGAFVVAWGTTLLAPLLLLLAPLSGTGPSVLGWAGALPLLAIVLTQAGLALEQGTRARGERPTRALLRSLWLFDLAWVLGHGLLALLLPLGGLWLLSTLLSGALFAPPPASRAPT